MDLRANTAVDVLIGPFVDLANGYTAEEGLTPVVLLSKNGQALAAKNDATDPTHDDAGYYNCELDATDTDTEGQLVLVVEADGTALPVRHEFSVLAEAAWDSLYVAKDDGYMDVNVKAVSEGTTAADTLESACDSYSATRGLAGTALPNAAAGAAGGLPTDSTGKTAFNDLSAAAMLSAITDDDTKIDGSSVNAVEAKVDNTLADTNEIQGKLPSKSYLAGTDNSDGDVELDDATGNYPGTVGGIAGTINTLDALDTAQDSQHGTTQGKVDAAQADLDILTGADGATLATAQGNYAPAKAGDAMALEANAVDDAAWNVTRVVANTDQLNGSAVQQTGGHIHALDDAGAALPAKTDVTGLNDLSAAQVNAEVVDALNVDTYAEPGQASPAATTTIRQMLHYLYKAWRNKLTTSSTEVALYNDAGDTVDQKAAVADDGTTFTRGEIETGP